MRAPSRPLLMASATVALAFLLTGCPKRPMMSGEPSPPGNAPAATQAGGPPAAPTHYVRQEALAPVHFDFDSARLRDEEAGRLHRNARWLRTHPDHLVLVDGHADERGTPGYNRGLAERRAESVRAFLVSHGIAAGRITVASSGEERPACTDRTPDCQARNRRVTFFTRTR